MKRTKAILIVMGAMLLPVSLALTAFAAKSPVKERKVDPLLTRIQRYSFADEHNIQPGPVKERPKAALGLAVPSASPGAIVGNTWYDKQRNGSMRRMIARDTTGVTRVHFVWTRLTDSIFTARKCYYRCYNPATGQFDCEGGVPISDDEYAGYCVIDVTGDDRGIPAGHNNDKPVGGVYMAQAWWDDVAGVCDFSTTCRVPDTLGDACEYYPVGNGHIWPAMCWQEGADTILHVFAQESGEGIGPQPVAYFRSINPEVEPYIWDVEHFYCVDTVNDLAQGCDCTDDGKVVIAWTANLPKPGDCDTCSSHDYWGYTQRNNDLYYQISNDGGVNWQPRVNVTKNVEGEEGWRPYTDLSVLIDSRNWVHVVWNALYWPADAEQGGSVLDFRCRIFHVSEEDTNHISVVHDANWVMDECAPGAWNLNASKMTISECDNKMYVLFVQFGDSNAVPPVVNDCAVPSSPGGYRGRANGELYLCVSDNWGDNWDKARNLTNTYTPGCTLVAPGQGNCDSDSWPSMVKFGTNNGGSWPDNIVEPDGPDSPYTTNWFLDVQYINDNSAGAIISSEGWWTQSNVKWFRLKCVPPGYGVPPPPIFPRQIAYPAWTKHGTQKDTTVTIENTGNCPMIYNVVAIEDTPPPGWLDVSPTSGSIDAGNTDSLTVSLNVGGIVNAPGTIVNLRGRLVIDWQGDGCPPNVPQYYSLEISFYVADTLYAPVWDTVQTTCTKLIVTNTGNFGNEGIGRVNMDYVDAGDCDSTADVYVYDGSPVIGYQSGGDTIVNFSIFGTTYYDSNGFVPLGEHTPTYDSGDCEIFKSGKFVTHDSLIAVEKTWYAPKDPSGDTCSFVIERMMVYLNDTLAVPPLGVRIGEAIDFDIPADSNSRNSSGYDYNLGLLWQRGSEEDGAGCQSNANRWGGIAFLEVYMNGWLLDSFPYGGYIKDNATQVYPEGGFHPDSLYKHMGNSGFINSDTQNTDLHMVMTKIVFEVLLKVDTIVIYAEIVTHWNGSYDDFLDEVAQSKQWYKDHIQPEPQGCCIGIRGNVNGDQGEAISVADLTFLVDYLFFGGAAPPCFEEGDVDGSGAINVADLTYLVDFMFFAGPDPPPCPPVK